MVLCHPYLPNKLSPIFFRLGGSVFVADLSAVIDKLILPDNVLTLNEIIVIF